MGRELASLIGELEEFVEQQKQYYAFRKHSYPFLKEWIKKAKEAMKSE